MRAKRLTWILFALALLTPALDAMLGGVLPLTSAGCTICIFAIMALGLNVITGFTGLLHLGMAAFMAIGAYTFAIATTDIYPFQIGFWPGLLAALAAGAIAGFILGAPTLRLRGDYLAIVTLGFGEIVQDVLKNLEGITKGTQGINPLPAPQLPPPAIASRLGTEPFDLGPSTPTAWFYLLLGILGVTLLACWHLRDSRPGRSWVAIREDELAARCMGIRAERAKLSAFATGAALAALAGGLWVSLYSSTGEPANYDFQISILALCIVIVGGMGSIPGMLLGAVVMIGIDSLVLSTITSWMAARGWASAANVLTTPSNWKFLIFGLALLLMMRFRPQGILPARVAAEAQS